MGTWRQVFLADSPKVGSQAAARCIRPRPEIQDAACRFNRKPSAPIARFRSRSNLLKRRDREIEKARKFARIVPHESLADIGCRIQSGVIELIAESELSRHPIL